MKRTILVTGGAGYIGSILTGMLRRNHDQVIVLDNGLVATESSPFEAHSSNEIRIVQGDVGDIALLQTLLPGVDAVVHLASVVGDPACGADPDLAWRTNYLATVRLAQECREAGVRRFVFASTCSNYGWQSDDSVDELAPLNPQSIYAQTKILAEHYLLSIKEESFTPTILRLSTVYGLSPRMRFDLAVNLMTARAVLQHEVAVFGGEQWRPFIHIQDAARAIMRVLQADPARAGGVFNCGSDAENYRLRQVGELIAQAVPGSYVTVKDDQSDKRSYRVSFRRIRDQLGFTTSRTVADGIHEIRDAIEVGQYHDFAEAKYSNVLSLTSRVPVR